MKKVQDQINEQLLKIIKEIDEKIESPYSKIQMLQSVANVHSTTNK